MNQLLNAILKDDLITAAESFKQELNQKIFEKLKERKARVYIEPKKSDIHDKQEEDNDDSP